MSDIYEQAMKNAKKNRNLATGLAKSAVETGKLKKKIDEANEKAKKEEAAKKKAEAEKKKAASGGKNKSNGANKTTNGKKTNLPQKHGSNADKELVAIQKADKKESLKSRKSSTVTNFQQERRKKAKKTASSIAEETKKQASWLARDIKSDFLPTEERQKEQTKIAKEKQADYEKKGGFANDKVGQFITGAGNAVLDNTIGLPYAIVKGEKLSDSDFWKDRSTVDFDTMTESGAAARSAGELAGTMLSYAIPYGAASKLTAKAAGKVLATGAGKKALSKATTEGSKDLLKTLTKDAIADATIGTTMNYGIARGQGLEGKELATDMAKNAALDFGIGGLMDTAPWVLKAIKNTKLAKQAGNVVDEAVDGAKTAVKETTEETAETVTKTAAEQKNDYLQELANKIKNIDEQKAQTNSRTTTDGRRTQTNRRVQNAKAVINSEVDEANKALNSEYDELINEFAEVAGMEPDEFVEWQAKKAADDIPDTTVDPNTGETIPNPAKQADTMEDPLTGETVPSTKQADTVIDPETGETVPNSELKDMFNGVDEADLSPESKAKVYKAVEERTGVKVVEKPLKKGDGFYRDGVIYINSNSTKPKFTVLKHELTHYMQTSKNYDAFSEFIFDGLRRKGKDIDALRADKRAVYKADGVDLTDEEVDFELVAEFCGEFLFNSEKSIDRLARKDPNLLRWLYEWAVDTIKKLGADEDTKFLINAQRKYEKALKDAKIEVNGKSQYLFTRANSKEIAAAEALEKNGASPEEIKQALNLHRGFGDQWLYEVDDKAARYNISNFGSNAKKTEDKVNLRDAINHPELWKRLDENKKEWNIDDYNVGYESGLEANGVERPSKKEIGLNPNTSSIATILHEMQHAIQTKQNLPKGSSANEWYGILEQYDKDFKEIAEKEKKARSDINVTAQSIDFIRRTRGDKHFETLYQRFKSVPDNEMYNTMMEYYFEMEQKNLLTDEAEDFFLKMEDAFSRYDEANEKLNTMAYEAYRDTAGEIESRNVADRFRLDKEQRKNTMPDTKNSRTLFMEDKDYKGQLDRRRKDGAQANSEVQYAEDDVPFSLGKNTIEDEALKKTSQNLYGEKGNKYLQGGKSLPETQKKASKGTQATIDETAKVEKTLPTNGKAESGKKLPKKQAVSKSVSADEKNPKAELTYEQAAELYETYKNGTPKTLPAKGDVSKAADTIIGSDYIGDEMRTAIKENIDNAVKTTKSNKVTLDNVNAKIDKDGLTPSVKKFLKNVQKKNRFTEEDIATGAELLRRLDEKGDYETALDVTDGLIELMSQAGRTLQAANIFTSMTPYGKLRTIRKAAAEMSERYGKEVKLNEDLLRELFYEKDTVKADKIKRRLFNDLWDQIPATLGEKIDALRYTAMLSSPKTHIRNILGNVAMYVGKALSDGVETALEETVFKGKMNKMGAMRAKSMLNPFSKEDRMLKEKAGELFENIKDQLLNESSKYLEKGKVRPQENKVFNSKILEAGRKFVSGSLEKEDEIFMKINFQAAFAKICKANGLEVGELTAKEVRKFTAYAAEQAQAATFRDPNALASAMNKVYRYASDTSKSDVAGKIGKGILKTTMDTAVPFRRTPANILKQAWRYSPGGVAEGLARVATAKDAESLMKGIEILSNGVVGTPVVLAGAYAAYQGYVTGNVGDYSDKTASYNRMLGEQDYSLKVGDKTITLDWMSPYSMPFFVGAELGTALSEQGLTGLTATEMVDAMASITEPFLEMSMMQGLQDLMTNNYKGNATEVFVGNAMKSYVSQFVPTFAAQLAKTMAKTTSSTKTVNDGTTSGKIYTSMVAQMKNKVPGLYETNVDEVDVWGRTETKEDVWDYVRAGLRNILSPSTIKDINVTDVDKEILSVYDSLDDDKASVIPSTADSYVNYNSTKYDMTDSEWADFKKDIGKLRYDGLEDLFKTSSYKNATAKDKAKMIQNVYSNALQTAKKNYLISSGKMTKEEYNRSTLTSGAATKLIDQGKTTATKVVEAKEKVNKSGVTNKAILQAYVLAGSYDSNTIKAVGGYNSNGSYKISDNTISEAKALKSAGVTLSKLQKAYAQSDKNNNKSISREEAEAYLDSVNWSQDQKRAIFDALMTNPNTHNKY